MKISVCIPVYNSEKTIRDLVDDVFEKLSSSYELELILVNDGSVDGSDELCRQIVSERSNVKYAQLRRNFGEHNAVMCALGLSTGDYVVIIDDDFQNPPSEIKKLVDVAECGADVVYSAFAKKKHNKFRNWGSKFTDLVSTWLLDKPKGLYLSSFKVISRSVVREIILYKGPAPYIDGLILRVTKNIRSVEVDHKDRIHGQSNYTFGKLISLWLNMFVNFSVKPLRVFSFFGLTVTFLSFLVSFVFIVQKIMDPSIQLGWTSVMVTVLFFSGVQICFLGLIGEYVGKHYHQSSGAPQWVIKELICNV